MSVARNTLPPLSFGTGGGLAPGVESLPDIETHLLFVDRGDNAVEDGSRQNPFHTIAAALVAANALAPGAANRVMLLIYPGEYAESGLGSVDYVGWVGVGGRDAVRIEGTSTVLTVSHEHTSYWNLTFCVTADANMIDIRCTAAACEFHNCVFDFAGYVGTLRPVYFGILNAKAKFEDCAWANGTQATRGTGFVGGAQGHTVELLRCTFAAHVYIGTSAWTFDGCTFTDGHILVGSPNVLALTVKDCSITTSQIAITIGISTSLTAIGNRLNSGGTNDIAGVGAASASIIRGNVMTRGMNSVGHIDPVRNVGAAGMLDWYTTLNNAVASLSFDGAVIRLLVDVTLTTGINPAYNCTIDGCGKHRITRINNVVVSAESSREIILRDLEIRGYVRVYSKWCLLSIEDCLVLGKAVAYGGDATSRLRIVRSTVIASDAYAWALELLDADPQIYVEDSYLIGSAVAAGYAVYWNTGTNNNLHVRRSRLFHGQLGANSPFGRSGAQQPLWYGWQNSFNADPDATGGWSTNQVPIGQRYDTIDPNADFD